MYETAFAIIEQVPLAETTILFAPVAGAMRYQKYILDGAVLFIVHICVIETPLYVTPVILAPVLFAVATLRGVAGVVVVSRLLFE